MTTDKEQILDDFDHEPTQSYEPTNASNFGKWVAISSFLVGTILLLAAFLTPTTDSLFIWGYFFLIGAFFFNLIIFIALLFIGPGPSQRHVNRKMALKMLLNIPIALLYIYIVFGYALRF